MLFLRNLEAATIAAILVALVVGITFHEFSHAFVADQLGDHRPRALGRVSLNPADHIDPMGALMFVLVGFGWGKPVPVNMGALRPGRIGLSWVAIAS
jgi:Zn-dependent protease